MSKSGIGVRNRMLGVGALPLALVVWASGFGPVLAAPAGVRQHPSGGASTVSSATQATTANPPGSRNSTPSTVKPNDEDYVIGPGDMLSINVWKEPDLTRVLPVRPDGRISLPLVGEVQASGLTPVKLRNDLTEKLKKFVSDPEVTVIVQEARAHTFNVIGEVAKPGTYDLSRPLTVLDAIAAAGGLQEFAKSKKIYVLRTMPNGAQQRLPFNYKVVIKGEATNQNIQLQSGDTIVVP